MSIHTTMPTPKFSIGEVVKLKDGDWRNYYLRKHLEACVRAWRNVEKADGTKNRRVPKHLKAPIRRAYKVMKKATTAEVAGVYAFSMQGSHGTGANQCYIGGGSGWSGIYWQYSLLFRWKDRKGNHLFVISECPIAMEQDLTR